MEAKKEIRSIGILCSGGDAPGMNCAIRSVVRTAIASGLKVYGIKRGYTGLLEGDIEEMFAYSVGNIIQHGGTILQTSRCKEFIKPEIRQEAANILRRKNIDALIVIGGNGSFNGAWELNSETGMPVLGIPGTIDNDIKGTEYAIGFDTAVQTAIEAVDKIRDTAASHARTFIIEVMGRKSPAIAFTVGVCTGAENVVLPGSEINYSDMAEQIRRGMNRGKTSSIIIVAEGEVAGMSYKIQDILDKEQNLEAHVCILGHIQRGGNPSGVDRFTASKMGYMAVKGLLQGNLSHVTIQKDGKIELANLKDCLEKKTEFELPYLELVQTLSI